MCEGAVAVGKSLVNKQISSMSFSDRQFVNYVKEVSSSTGKSAANEGISGGASATANVATNAVANSGGIVIEASRCQSPSC